MKRWTWCGGKGRTGGLRTSPTWRSTWLSPLWSATWLDGEKYLHRPRSRRPAGSSPLAGHDRRRQSAVGAGQPAWRNRGIDVCKGPFAAVSSAKRMSAFSHRSQLPLGARCRTQAWTPPPNECPVLARRADIPLPRRVGPESPPLSPLGTAGFGKLACYTASLTWSGASRPLSPRRDRRGLRVPPSDPPAAPSPKPVGDALDGASEPRQVEHPLAHPELGPPFMGPICGSHRLWRPPLRLRVSLVRYARVT
jgi:hypothetical protein